MSLTEPASGHSQTQPLEILAGKLAAACRAGLQIEPPEELSALRSRDDGYEVQAAMAQQLGQPTGWKVSLNTRDADPWLSCAPFPHGKVVESPAAFVLGNRGNAYLEAELAIKLRRDLIRDAGPISRDAVLASMASCHLVFEVLCSRLAIPLADMPGLNLLADCGGAAMLVVGDELALEDIARSGISIAFDGEPTTSGSHWQHEPIGLVAKLAQWLADRGQHLRAGDMITTGAICLAEARRGLFEATCGNARVALEIVDE